MARGVTRWWTLCVLICCSCMCLPTAVGVITERDEVTAEYEELPEAKPHPESVNVTPTTGYGSLQSQVYESLSQWVLCPFVTVEIHFKDHKQRYSDLFGLCIIYAFSSIGPHDHQQPIWINQAQYHSDDMSVLKRSPVSTRSDRETGA